MPYLPCVEISPTKTATASVIWLHGLGANGHDFEPLVPELRLPEDMPVRFILPHAPSIPVTINGGAVMPAWYDILSMDIDRKFDASQLQESALAVHALIEREIDRGISSDRIIVVGFSQGGAVAYEAALSFPKPLAGLITMSTYFATHDTIQCSKENKDIPIHIFHGKADPVVPELLGQQAVKFLNEKFYQADYKTYPMQHEVCMPQIEDISNWIQNRLS